MPVNTAQKASLIHQHVTKTLPLVKHELARWSNLASSIPNPNLRQQALASIRTKAFHCQGGSIFASYPKADRRASTDFIVAYQTISDYLDNLVDSLEVHDEQAFAQLHLAMVDALNPGGEQADYYRYYPHQDDGGYLGTLVETCRARCLLPSYHLVQPEVVRLARLYSGLQTYKHLHLDKREAKLFGWVAGEQGDWPDLKPWEFAAATGSTLGTFVLHAAAFNPELTVAKVEKYRAAYFPWIAGLHILLDYLLDQRVDRETKQLNFVTYYNDEAEMRNRLSDIFIKARACADGLSHKVFHQIVIQGLLALYLSDEKVKDPEVRQVARHLLRQGGVQTRFLHRSCQHLRLTGLI